MVPHPIEKSFPKLLSLFLCFIVYFLFWVKVEKIGSCSYFNSNYHGF